MLALQVSGVRRHRLLGSGLVHRSSILRAFRPRAQTLQNLDWVTAQQSTHRRFSESNVPALISPTSPNGLSGRQVWIQAITSLIVRFLGLDPWTVWGLACGAVDAACAHLAREQPGDRLARGTDDLRR